MSEMGTVLDLGSSKKRSGSATLTPCNSSTRPSRRVSGYSSVAVGGEDSVVRDMSHGTVNAEMGGED